MNMTILGAHLKPYLLPINQVSKMFVHHEIHNTCCVVITLVTFPPTDFSCPNFVCLASLIFSYNIKT